jgi:hypothetical protein
MPEKGKDLSRRDMKLEDTKEPQNLRKTLLSKTVLCALESLYQHLKVKIY